nr:carboxypeptidase-like regulatory domain-containing protein [Haloechinothrix alba]
MLSGGGGVTGTVTDALDARPLPRALVVLTGSDGRVAGSSFTDGDGVFTITQLTSGTYTLVASADNHRPRASIVTVPAHDHAAADVQLEAFGQVHGFARVAGNGRPAADARVTLLDPDGTVLDQTVTGQDGEYQFRDLPEGEYTLLATGYRPVRSVLRVSAGRKARHELRLDYPGNGTAGLDGAPG